MVNNYSKVIFIQVKCEVIVKKTSQETSDARYEAVFFRSSLHMTLSEPQRGEDPTPEKYISIVDLSPLGQISQSKIKRYLK